MTVSWSLVFSWLDWKNWWELVCLMEEEESSVVDVEVL
jgi:hypothetical protein